MQYKRAIAFSIRIENLIVKIFHIIVSQRSQNMLLFCDEKYIFSMIIIIIAASYTFTSSFTFCTCSWYVRNEMNASKSRRTSYKQTRYDLKINIWLG